MLDYVRFNTKVLPASFGFNNTGVICWMNALTQFMLSLTSVSETLLKYKHTLVNNKFAMTYIGIIELTINSPNNVNLQYASSELLQALEFQLRKCNDARSLYSGQQCAHDGFTAFVDMLNCPQVIKLINIRYSQHYTCMHCGDKLTNVFDNFVNYFIPIYKSYQITSDDEFNKFIHAHRCPDDECTKQCNKCGINDVMPRKELLQHVHSIILITFMHQSGRFDVHYPNELKFKELRADKTINYLTYKLVSVIEHGGTTGLNSSGHYWSKSLRRDYNSNDDSANWYSLNDSHVGNTEVKPCSNTFMLAYHIQ